MTHILGLLGPLQHHEAAGKREVLRQVLREVRMAPTIVEVGTMRSTDDTADGLSTLLFADHVAHHGGRLYSVDRNPDAAELARRCLGDAPGVVLVTGDGAAFLRRLAEPIHLLYLDGSDDPAETLAQAKAALGLVRGPIVIDDVMPYGGNARGKGTLAIPHLEALGWRTEEHAIPASRYRMAVLRRQQ